MQPTEPQATRPGHSVPLGLPMLHVAYQLVELQIQLPQSRPRCTLRRDTRVVGPAPDVGGLLLRLIRISILSSYCP